MRKTDYIPIGVVALLAGFIGFQVATAPPRAPAMVVSPEEMIAEQQPATSSASAVSASVEAGRPPLDVDGLMQMSANAAPVRDLEDIRRRLRMGESGTYLAEALKQLDSSLYRWQDRMVEPIRVWIPPAPRPNSDELTRLVRQSFDPWTSSGIPVRFTFVLDSASADVRILWIERFDVGNRLGHTKVVYDQHRWLNPGAEITLAMRYPQGQPVSSPLLLAIAQHEVGHLLGLAHSADSTDIMFPTVYARGLSPSDVNTVRLVYSVAAGSIK